MEWSMGQDVVDMEIALTLKVSQINNILSALQELPAKIANPLNNLIVAQATEQINAINGMKKEQ